jgi:predicted PurR-regulated permease PerM
VLGPGYHVGDLSRVGMVSFNCHAAGMSEQFARVPGRWSRLWRAAQSRSVPLGAILTAVSIVVVVYLGGRLIYELRQSLLLIFLAGFVALLLNPLVVATQRHFIRRRGSAVTAILAVTAIEFGLFAFVMGVPLVHAITDLSKQLPVTVSQAEHGKGWIGQLATRYHLQSWVAVNAPKLVTYAKALARPVLSLGNGTVSIAVSFSTFVVLVILMLAEAANIRRAILGLMEPRQAAALTRLSADINQALVGYMLGNLLTSLIAGTTIFVTLFFLGIPFALLWAIWFALVDLIPTIGGTLAGIPIVLFALSQSLNSGIIALVVCVVYNQIEAHILNPVVISRTVRVSPLLSVLSILLGVSIGTLISGPFGGLVGALLAIPSASVIQTILREAWRATSPPAPSPLDPSQLDPSPLAGTPPATTPALKTEKAAGTRSATEERYYAEQIIRQAQQQTASAEALASYARNDAEQTRREATRMLELLRADAARERDELRTALQVNARALEEACAVLRERAQRAERDLKHANSELRRLRPGSRPPSTPV